jgi:hypothetical protein
VRRLLARGALQVQRHPLKKGLLITPKPHWPRFDGGLSMELVGSAGDGCPVFEYRHSAAYQHVRAQRAAAQPSRRWPEARRPCGRRPPEAFRRLFS